MTQLRHLHYVFGGLMIVTLSLLVITVIKGDTIAFIFGMHKKTRPLPVLPGSLSSNMQVTSQKDRIDMVKRTCDRYRHLLNTTEYRNHLPVYMAAPAYNWSYCKIGKIGSTLWTQFFYVLHHEGDTVNDILTSSREDIHAKENVGHILFGVKNSMWNVTRMVLSARNPYTRLFSAFIDRMFIPSTSISIRGQKDDKCKSQISFSEFLENVIRTTRRGHFDYHWSPVFNLCKPCEISPKFIFKQENFKSDFHDVMTQTSLEVYKVDVMQEAIRSAANWSGFAVVDDVLAYVMPINMRNALDCQDYEEASIRLWEALKIQGHIPHDSPFPRQRYKKDEDFKDLEKFRSAMVDAGYPLAKSKASLQRLRYFNDFYKDVNPGIIQGIQNTYRMDFDMFGYSYEPPPWYQ